MVFRSQCLFNTEFKAWQELSVMIKRNSKVMKLSGGEKSPKRKLTRAVVPTTLKFPKIETNENAKRVRWEGIYARDVKQRHAGLVGNHPRAQTKGKTLETLCFDVIKTSVQIKKTSLF